METGLVDQTPHRAGGLRERERERAAQSWRRTVPAACCFAALDMGSASLMASTSNSGCVPTLPLALTTILPPSRLISDGIPAPAYASATAAAPVSLLQIVLLAAQAFPGGQAGREVSEKEEREPLRWKRG